MYSSIWADLFLVSFTCNLVYSAFLVSIGWINTKPLLRKTIAMMTILAAAIMTVDGMQLLSCYQYQKWLPWSYFPLVVGLLLYSWISIKAAVRIDPSELRLHSPYRLLSLVCVVAITGWCWSRIHTNELLTELSIGGCAPGQLTLDQQWVGRTKLGNPIAIFRLNASDQQFAEYASAQVARKSAGGDSLIVRGTPDRHYNCHGWVFTGGKHLLRGDGVECILHDHNYIRVMTAQENDLAIYRSAGGTILHTALVRSILEDGTVLVESKWGVDGRYLHQVQDQPYSQHYEYYRSPDGSHLITVESCNNLSEATSFAAS